MSDDVTLVDLIDESTTTRDSVENRILRRGDLLREWLHEGVPASKSFPRSLRATREWEDVELNIRPIASPNEFTTTHAIHGNSVRDIAELLTALKKRFDRPSKSARKRTEAAVRKSDSNAIKKQYEAIVSQWQSERDKRLQEKRRADSADARSILLLEENAEKDKQISELQHRLLSHEGLRTVK